MASRPDGSYRRNPYTFTSGSNKGPCHETGFWFDPLFLSEEHEQEGQAYTGEYRTKEEQDDPSHDADDDP
jgi:inosine/xanthosine triphosphate pyrophosphatase family protein